MFFKAWKHHGFPAPTTPGVNSTWCWNAAVQLNRREPLLLKLLTEYVLQAPAECLGDGATHATRRLTRKIERKFRLPPFSVWTSSARSRLAAVMEPESPPMKRKATKARPYRPAGPRQRPDNDNLPPLVRVADCYTNRSKGRFVCPRDSRRQLEDLIKRLNLPVKRLGPRTTCLTKETVLALQNAELV